MASKTEHTDFHKEFFYCKLGKTENVTDRVAKLTT